MKKANKKISLLLTATLTLTGTLLPYSQINVKAGNEVNFLSALSAPAKAYLYNFTDAGSGYQVIFSDKNDYTGITDASLTYRVYIDNNYVTNVSASKKYISAADIASLNLTANTYHNFKLDIKATWADGSETTSPYSASTTFYYGGAMAYNTGIGSVYITTSRDSSNEYINLYTDTSKTKVNAAITVKNANGTVNANDFGTVNVRGNSTALAAKKPYNIKFDSKQNIFGMGKAKKWSLLANIFDKTLLRNKIGLDFQRGLEQSRNANQVYTGMCQPVDLYLDGKYVGNYLLTESVQSGDTRVNIDESFIDDNDNATEGSGTQVTINGTTYTVYDSLLELANDVKDIPSRYDEESYYFKTNSYNEYFAINSPERTNTSYGYNVNDQNKPQWVKDNRTFVNAFESVLSGSYNDATKYNLISQFIDVNSFVDFYITSEYFMTKDINFSSTRFYIKNGKLYGGPLWDLDLSSGNIVDHPGYTDFYAQGYAWFRALMKNSYFKEAVKQRFTELQPTIKNLYATGGLVDREYNNILQSANMNYSQAYNTNDYTGWHLSTNYGEWNSTTTYSTYIEYINEYKTWLANRNNWLRTQWNITDPENTVTVSDSLELTGYQISDVAEGFRTLYSAEPVINNKQVTEVGLIYGIAGYSSEADIILNSASTYVHSFAATPAGTLDGTTYAMTMLFAASTEYEFMTDMYIRVYAILSDGSVVYSPVGDYSIYRVANYLYQNKLSNRPSLHTYLYNNILKVANPSYTEVEFNWNNYLAHPGDTDI